ncbi:MAG: peptidylprolyl isomerase [Lachnospiraceae bacterium]|nr:peptidylprolyl isomerase [Lachnospiraceae bacterium]
MKNRILSLLLLGIILVTGISGCTKRSVDENDIKDDKVVFQYGSNIVTKAEVYVYINTIKERYESQYGDEVWALALPDADSDEISMVDLTKQEVVEEIIKVKTLYAHADDFDITLTEKEKSDIEEKAKSFYDGLTDNEKLDMSLTNDKIIQILTENAIAKKVEDKILEDNPIEISDEQARMTTFYDMYFDCYDIAEDGSIVPYDKEKRSEQYEKALAACSTLATAVLDDDEEAESIEKLSEYYKLEHSKTQTMAPEDILETYGEDIYNLLYSMKNGEYSTVVESEYGYHVFQMIALTDIDETAARKAQMTQNAIDDMLSDTISKWQKEIDKDFTYPDSVNMDVYDTIELKSE